jgi:hypothetical protein
MSHLSIFVVLVAVFSVFSCAKKAEFKPFVSTDGRFKISTPTELGRKSQSFNFEDGQVTMHSYAAERDSVVYVVNYFDIPEPINTELRKQRPGYTIPARSAMLESNGWIADSIKGDELRVSASEVAYGERFTATTANKKQVIYVRLLWFGNRIYQIMAAYPAKPSYLQETYAQKFAWSFEIQPAQ